jgi:3-hydroxybutyryl-CoA dehydrogenase
VQLHDTRFGAGDAAKKGIAEALGKLVDKGGCARGRRCALARIATVVTLAGRLRRAARRSRRSSRTSPRSASSSSARERRRRGLHPRDEHVVAVDHGARRAAKRPERIVGMHFFNPAPLMPLVESRDGLATSRDVAERVRDRARVGQDARLRDVDARLHRQPLRAAVLREALRLLGERAADSRRSTPSSRVRRLPDGAVRADRPDRPRRQPRGDEERLGAYFHDPRYAPSVLQEERVAAGFLGRKIGSRLLRLRAGSGEAGAEDGAAAEARAVTVHGDLGVAAPLATHAPAGVSVERARADSRFPAGAIHVPGGGGAWLALTDGRTATARVVDRRARPRAVRLALDYATATRSRRARRYVQRRCAGRAVGALQAAGVDVRARRRRRARGDAHGRDAANEAADAVVQGVAAPRRSTSRCRRASTIRADPRVGRCDRRGVVRDVLANLPPTTARIAIGSRRCSRGARATGGKLGG